MKYDVLVRRDEKQCQIFVRNEYREYYNDHIETEEFNPQDWAEIIVGDAGKSGNSMWYNHLPVYVKLEEETRLKEWVYLKTIEIDNGELRAKDYYEINGKKCRFEIVYNDKTDKVELRVDYTDETVEHELNELTKAKFKEYQAIMDEHKKKKDAEALIRAMIEADKRDEEENQKYRDAHKKKPSFIERLINR